MRVLREFVRNVLSESRYVVVYSPLGSDLEQALFWLKNNKKIKSRGAVHKEGDFYLVRVNPRGSKRDVEKVINDRFGRFVRVR